MPNEDEADDRAERRKVRGACLCRRVTFEIKTPVKFVVHCHCTMCRRAHGAPFVTWTSVPNDRLTIVSGEEVIKLHQSSENAARQFCRECGSPMFFTGDRWPGEIHVAVALLEDDLGVEPRAHVFFDDRAPWLTVDDQLPRYGGKTGTEPLAEAGRG